MWYKALATKVPALLAAEDVTAMFFNLEKVMQLTMRFFAAAKTRIMNWEDGAMLGDLFAGFLSEQAVQQEYFHYVNNMPRAFDTYNRLYAESPAFREVRLCLAFCTSVAPLTPPCS